jgi:hypothetical protein
MDVSVVLIWLAREVSKTAVLEGKAVPAGRSARGQMNTETMKRAA